MPQQQERDGVLNLPRHECLRRSPQGEGGDTADGHCSVSYKTGTGTCVIIGGTGALAGLHANLEVSSDADFVVFTWEGRYHFEP